MTFHICLQQRDLFSSAFCNPPQKQHQRLSCVGLNDLQQITQPSVLCYITKCDSMWIMGLTRLPFTAGLLSHSFVNLSKHWLTVTQHFDKG